MKIGKSSMLTLATLCTTGFATSLFAAGNPFVASGSSPGYVNLPNNNDRAVCECLYHDGVSDNSIGLTTGGGIAWSIPCDGSVCDYVFEVDIARLLPSVTGEIVHKPLSRFPAVMQDIALLVDTAVPQAKVAELISASNLVAGAQLFDVYEGEHLPDGKKSLAFAVQFQAADRTLTEKEVADARSRIIRRLQHELGAELRGG